MNFKKIVVLFVIVLGCISSSFAFSDLPNDHWAYNQVKIMQEKGVISGFTDGTFRPQNSVTREQFATILTKALALKETNDKVNFIDVQQDRWSKQYIDAASPYLTGYLNNGEYYFNPTSYAVREEIAVAVVKAAGLENEIPDYTVLNKFTDKDLISDNLRSYIAIAVQQDVMSGNADGTFNPLGTLTRAETAALMHKLFEGFSNMYLYGDLNDDGIVDYKDYQILDEGFEGINAINADVDISGQVDWRDRIILFAYVEGITSEMPHTCDIYKNITNVDGNEQEHRVRYLCDCGGISFFELEKHQYIDGKCGCGAIEKNEMQEGKSININTLVNNINNSRLLDDESMKLILSLMGMQDFNIKATKKSTNTITINNKDYNIDNNILTFPIETAEDTIIVSCILDSVAIMHGIELDYSDMNIVNDSYSIAKNGFEVVDLEEISEYDPDTGWTSTFYVGTFRIDISKAPQK